jgi:glutathione S-transferase
MAELRLWSWRMSPFAGKARIAFAEKGVEVELLEIDPRNRPPRLRELNPTSRVPVLEIDGRGIRESTVICDWLEDTHPEPPFWPADPTARAAARGLVRFVDDELTIPFFRSMRKEVFGLDKTDHPDAVQHLRAQLARNWPTAEKLLGQGDGRWLLAGDEPTMADLAAMPLAVRLPQWKPDLVPDPDEYPLTAAWMEQLRQRPSAAEVDRGGEQVADA